MASTSSAVHHCDFIPRLEGDMKEAWDRLQELLAADEEAAEVAAHYHDNELLVFLASWTFNAEKTVELLKNHWKWKACIDSVPESRVLEELATGKLELLGCDPEGRCVLNYDMSKHNPSDFTNEESLLASFVVIHHAMMTNFDAVCKGFVMLADMKNFGKANMSMTQAKFNADCVPNLPMRMHAMVMIDAPWWISMTMKMVRAFTPADVMARVHNVSRKSLKSEPLLLDEAALESSGEVAGWVAAGKVPLWPFERVKIDKSA
eukprot:TRINITY_DN198_c0_g1_i1.p2 TRINITY_DN198_c0_g1~~TRINITY_DN198_c0_g1_i1.p2  ORF type:complete len:262 (+),score=106.61 TRINITY_DN198_c0_g1_i1:170-955(+)